MNASGCGVTVKDYGHALAHDPAYAAKAQRIAALTRDLSELLPDLVPRCRRGSIRRAIGSQPHPLPDVPADDRRIGARLAFHPPCTLQHGQQLRGGVESGPARARLRGRDRARPKATCAAARPAPTRCCSPSWPTRCATASSRTCAAAAADHRVGQHRLHPAPADRHDDAGAALGRGARRRAELNAVDVEGATGQTCAVPARRDAPTDRSHGVDATDRTPGVDASTERSRGIPPTQRPRGIDAPLE